MQGSNAIAKLDGAAFPAALAALGLVRFAS